MILEEYLQYLQEDTLDTATGDDNLLVILRTDNDNKGVQFWQVKVLETKKDKELEKYTFYNKKEARNKFKEIKKEF